MGVTIGVGTKTTKQKKTTVDYKAEYVRLLEELNALKEQYNELLNNSDGSTNDDELLDIIADIQEIIDNLIASNDNSIRALEILNDSVTAKNATYTVGITDNSVRYSEYARISYPMEDTTVTGKTWRFTKPVGGFDINTDTIPEDATETTTESTETHTQVFILLRILPGENGGPTYLAVLNNFELNEDEEPGVTKHTMYTFDTATYKMSDSGTLITIAKDTTNTSDIEPGQPTQPIGD